MTEQWIEITWTEYNQHREYWNAVMQTIAVHVI